MLVSLLYIPGKRRSLVHINTKIKAAVNNSTTIQQGTIIMYYLLGNVKNVAVFKPLWKPTHGEVGGRAVARRTE